MRKVLAKQQNMHDSILRDPARGLDTDQIYEQTKIEIACSSDSRPSLVPSVSSTCTSLARSNEEAGVPCVITTVQCTFSSPGHFSDPHPRSKSIGQWASGIGSRTAKMLTRCSIPSRPEAKRGEARRIDPVRILLSGGRSSMPVRCANVL